MEVLIKTLHVVAKNVLVCKVKEIVILTLIVKPAFFVMIVWTIVEQNFQKDLTAVLL